MDLEASGTDYEVFLCFRGPDTRQGFTDVLYDHMDRAGIRVFRNDDELAVGDKIIEKVLLAVENSQICVPVFSETFASSKWCLRQVRRMIKLKKEVFPIFYKVTPADVKLKTPVYKTLMLEHEQSKFRKNKVEKWKDALKDITKFKGRELSNTSYTKFCKMFVEEILIKLKPRKRYDLDDLVGIEAQLESAIELLDIGACGVRYILIHGMGGIGKTTLAKVIFNKVSASFDSCSFLENLQDSMRRDGLEYLQRQLGDSLDPKSGTTSNLARDMRGRLCGKKVLVVLDDVDSGEQVEKLVGRSRFASGSRIIMTSRNISFLNECKDLDGDCIYYLEMTTLKDVEALQLFEIYAFRKVSPPATYRILSKEAVTATGGLPLALKVMASLLRGKNERVWRDVIAKSRKIPLKEVKDRLKISYDVLDYEQKQIFLDIACFFTGTDKLNPSYMWEACGFYPAYGLEVLVSMSLVRITDESTIWMHDQLRDLGRDIVREESISNPMKRSRIWLKEDGRKVVMGKNGKEMVEALSLREPLAITLMEEHCASFDNIRFLELAGGQLEGTSEDMLSKLVWLSWHFCPSEFKISQLYFGNLAILDLSSSFIDENWRGWSHIQMAHNLKVLDLRNCQNLTRTPDFTGIHTLERLILSQCSQLATIGSSIGKLRSLKFLDLRCCNSLRGLPEEFGSLNYLEEIYVSGNHGTFSLPKSIGNLKSLVSLKLEGLTINCIPDSIGELLKLKHLSIILCYGMKEFPESLGDLESLVQLNLSHNCQLRELPNSIGGLVQLKELNMLGCLHIKEFPLSLLYLPSLVRLDLSWTAVRNLPASIGDLQELQFLSLSGCRVRTLPASIGRLKKLVELHLHYCEFLEEVPSEIGGLSSLRKLVLSCSGIRKLPSTISQLSLLKELQIQRCVQLQELPELPAGLTNPNVVSSCSKKSQDFSELDVVSYLQVTDRNDSGEIQELSGLKNLEVFLSSSTLPFDLSSLAQLESLRLIIHPLQCVSSSLVLPSFTSMKDLARLHFQYVFPEDKFKIRGVKELENLETITVHHSNSKFIDICLAKNLRSLSIGLCESLRPMPELLHLKKLIFRLVRWNGME